MIPNKKALEIILSAVRGFEKPIPELEQYVTPSDIAAELLWTAFMDGNIEKKKVFDLGCGTGILTIGAALLGAKSVTGFDIDRTAFKNAFELAEKNARILRETNILAENIKFVEIDVKHVEEKCDTVVMNPPFGVQTEHADRLFLEKAFGIANVIYSIHKGGSDKFLLSFAKDKNWSAVKLGEFRFVIKKSMDFHEKAKYPVEVELWKFLKS
ncbi:MAG: METTL5 family protein [Candidatus Nanoarchaeia archaeon]|nr:METTL5 family protein [Candidatus Nanoarchaeia archaeon]MDD5239547.1 METTL5 family protein [Candidatus Nanoarchaeia archaeon]